jgi:hypothetical protein
MELVIDRNIWLRGEGCGASYLYRESDEKQCCVGIWATQCLGATKGQIAGISALCIPGISDLFPEQNTADMQSALATLYARNDSTNYMPAQRERLIIEGFATIGVNVTFVN